MGIPLGPVREALTAARMAGPAVAKATKKTIRVLHNEKDFDSLTGMLKGEYDSNVKATMDDMLHPSSKTSAGYANDGYSAASMAKLPKGTVTNRAGTGAMRARVMGLARNAELGAMASSGKTAHASRTSAVAKSKAIAKRKAILKNMKNRK